MSISKYKIKKWINMFMGKSIHHVNQGVGTCYSKNDIKGYYNDLTEKVLKDDQNIMVPKYHMDNGEIKYFSIGIFQYALASYDLFLKTKNEIYKKKFYSCVKWAVDNQNEDGSWITFDHENPKFPYSSMAQGEGCSVLLRAYVSTKNDLYLTAAKKAIDFMLIATDTGGTAKYEKNNIFLFEFVNEPLVLNGWIFSYWGLREFSLICREERYKKAAELSELSIRNALKEYDYKFWSRYDLKKRIASPFYHKLHIAQLIVMYDLTNKEEYNYFAKKWNRQLKNPIYKILAILVKIIQKTFEK